MLGCPDFQHTNQGQGRLALAQIVTDIFAQSAYIPVVVQHVINQLECGADMASIGRCGLLLKARGPRQDGARLGGRFKKLGGFEAHHLQVSGLGHLWVMNIEQLKHLALGNDRGRPRHNLHDPHAVDIHHHLKGPRIEVVTHQDAGGIAKYSIGRPATASEVGFVHHIVVQ